MEQEVYKLALTYLNFPYGTDPITLRPGDTWDNINTNGLGYCNMYVCMCVCQI
jgi:hypothetical protein